MWIILALGAAFFAGVTSIFAKAGIKNVDSSLATALRTIVILIFSVIIVLIMGTFSEISKLNFKNTIFLILSGITTLLLWLSYFKALSLANVNKVAPIDKTSIVLTLILSSIFLKEDITLIKVISIVLILLGTYLMTSKNDNVNEDNKKWIIYALLTAFFTSVATIVGKVGIRDIESNFGLLIKTIVVFIIIWILIFKTKKNKDIKYINKKSWIFIILSGITTCLSWVCYFGSLKEKDASIVFPIEKLSIVVSVILSSIFLKEKLTKKATIGLITIVAGTCLLMI